MQRWNLGSKEQREGSSPLRVFCSKAKGTEVSVEGVAVVYEWAMCHFHTLLVSLGN